MLAAGDVPAHLVRRGIAADIAVLEVAELTGGVSSAVYAVRGDGLRLVVKHALPRFRVAAEWLVPTERALFEAQALELMAKLAPEAVPRLVDIDPDTSTLVMEAAPPSWRPWKALLLEGVADPAVAARLGALLRTLHAETGSVDIGSAESFHAQRVDPYFRTVQRRHPGLAGRIDVHVDRMLATRRCVVHGDYSPKNVLTGDGGLWVIDWEIAHRGDPAFDLAFLVNHLLLKAIHRPEARAGYEACSAAFLDAYRADGEDLEHVLGLVGCLMLARVDGKSPAEYLSAKGRTQARSAGTAMLSDPPRSLADAFATAAGDLPR